MGNLLGSPITDKETHVGSTIEGLQFGVSSMQGWRIHMEDAHICQPTLYAEEEVKDGTPGDNASHANDRSSGQGDKGNDEERVKNRRIPLTDHSLFAVFDGHGGCFAAEYSGKNLCRILSRQPKFVQYAKRCHEQAKRDADKVSLEPAEQATFNRESMTLLEGALRDAFVDLDKEIMREVQGLGNVDANSVYDESTVLQHFTPEDRGTAEVVDSKSGDAKDGGPDKAAVTAESEPVPNSNTIAGRKPQPAEDEDSGTTAVVLVLTPRWIVCANAGDSRAVYSKAGHRAVPLSYDHKPDDEEEERRIKDAGGYVSGGRVEGDLAVSRGLGDFRFKDIDTVLVGTDGERVNNMNSSNNSAGNPGVDSKNGSGKGGESDEKNVAMLQPDDQKVSPVPDIIVQNRNADHDEFIVVACDGIWDVQTNHECIKMIAELFDEGESHLGLLCEEVLDLCLRRGSKDNMTALVVKFPAQTVGEGGGVMARRELREAAKAEEEAKEGGSTGSDGDGSEKKQEGARITFLTHGFS